MILVLQVETSITARPTVGVGLVDTVFGTITIRGTKATKFA